MARLSQQALGQTPSQTIGPFFHYCLPWKGGADLLGQSSAGARLDLIPSGHDHLNQSPMRGSIGGNEIVVFGQVVDGAGAPIPDALVETWQANAAGRYNAPQDMRVDLPLDRDFIGFGRAATDAQGVYRFRTVRPGRVPGPGNTLQAPHVAMGVFGRGLLKRLVTRLYFADAPENVEDPVLNLVPADRRNTLIAALVSDPPKTYKFDIVLQGKDETVFFEI